MGSFLRIVHFRIKSPHFPRERIVFPANFLVSPSGSARRSGNRRCVVKVTSAGRKNTSARDELIWRSSYVNFWSGPGTGACGQVRLYHDRRHLAIIARQPIGGKRKFSRTINSRITRKQYYKVEHQLYTVGLRCAQLTAALRLRAAPKSCPHDLRFGQPCFYLHVINYYRTLLSCGCYYFTCRFRVMSR